MPWSVTTSCRYHTQDTNFYCGAACAMMVLAEIGVSHTALVQGDLYTSNHSHSEVGWETDPEGLRFTLMDRRPASFGKVFVVQIRATEADGTRTIVDALRNEGVSVCALVYEFEHWLVVRGIETKNRNSYVVNGLWVNNPVDQDNHPHDSDDVCGKGYGHGVENQWISLGAWQSWYFTGGDRDGSKQFITVCASTDPTVARMALASPTTAFATRSARSKVRPARRKLADADAVLRSLPRELKRFGLDKAKELKSFQRGVPRAPLLVRRLDKPDRDYYLVPSLAGNQVVGFSQVDARAGELQSVFSMRHPERVTLELPRVKEELVDRKIRPFRWGEEIRLVKDRFEVSRELVWRPCRQSWSPHLPFWQISIGSKVIGYRRLDGRLYPELTSGNRGG